MKKKIMAILTTAIVSSSMMTMMTQKAEAYYEPYVKYYCTRVCCMADYILAVRNGADTDYLMIVYEEDNFVVSALSDGKLRFRLLKN
jgi:IMP cyclohydrolase